MVTINFYDIVDMPNVIDKTLDDPTTLTGDFNSNMDTIHPLLRVGGLDLRDYNYCYIVQLGKYYYIDSYEIDRANYYIVHLTIDVLMTYRDDILALWGISRRSSDANPYSEGYIDSRDVRYNVSHIEFDNPFSNEHMIMIGVSS